MVLSLLMTKAAVFAVSFFYLGCPSSCYQPVSPRIFVNPRHDYDQTPMRISPNVSRRHWVAASIATATATATLLLPVDSRALAAEKEDSATIIASIRQAKKALQKLLDNWEESVIDCNYADVPRELLGADNKELLLEKASTFALFDKSVSVVTCKTNNKKIRDYLGRTGIGPMVGLDKKLRRAFDLIDDPDDLDAYVVATEAAQQALSRADSYSYTAGGDYDALNNFEKEDQGKVLENNSNLKQVRQSLQTAIDNLNIILKILDK